MQLRALRYFSQVAQSTSLRDAAEKLFVTPTAVTRQIEQLEHYYGAQLIERSPRGIKLTKEGEYLAQAVQATLRELDVVKEKIAATQSIVTGIVRICCAESLVGPFVAPTIADFRKLHPHVGFEIDVGSAPLVAEALVNGQVDLALTFYMPVTSELSVTHSCELQHKVMMAADHELAGKSFLTLRDIAQHPIAIPPANYSMRQSLESAARREGLQFDLRFVTSSLDVQKQLALLGQAIIIQPQLNVDDHQEQGRLIATLLTDLQLGVVKVDLCLPRKRSVSIASRLFHDMLAARIRRQNQ